MATTTSEEFASKIDNGDWYDGKLASNRIYITEDTFISANVEEDAGNVKVFYNTKDDDDITVPTVLLSLSARKLEQSHHWQVEVS